MLTISPQPDSTGNSVDPTPTFTSKSQVWSLDFHASEEATSYPHPKQWFHRRLRRQMGLSCLTGRNAVIFSSEGASLAFHPHWGVIRCHSSLLGWYRSRTSGDAGLALFPSGNASFCLLLLAIGADIMWGGVKFCLTPNPHSSPPGNYQRRSSGEPELPTHHLSQILTRNSLP